MKLFSGWSKRRLIEPRSMPWASVVAAPFPGPNVGPGRGMKQDKGEYSRRDGPWTPASHSKRQQAGEAARVI